MFLFSNFQHSSKSFWQMKRPDTIFVSKIEKKTSLQFSSSKSKSDPPLPLKPIRRKSVNALSSPVQSPNQANGFTAKTPPSAPFFPPVWLFISAIGVTNLRLFQFIHLCCSSFFIFFIECLASIFFFRTL